MDRLTKTLYLRRNPAVVRRVDDEAPHAFVDDQGRVAPERSLEPPRHHVPDHTGRTTVIYCANRDFYPGLSASLASLLSLHPDVPVVIYSWDLTLAQRDWLGRFATVLPRDPALPDDPTWGRVGLFSLDIPRAVYLDADTIVLRPIDGLLECRAKFGAARNLDWGIMENFRGYTLLHSLGLDPQAPSFNSGVFTVDVTHFGRRLYDRLLELNRLYAEHFILGDQSAFQLAFYLDDLGFEWIDTAYNTMAEFHDWDAAPQTPRLIHYAGPDKPWAPGCGQPGQSYFFRWSRIPAGEDR